MLSTKCSKSCNRSYDTTIKSLSLLQANFT
nr:MAG TPA: hypothetical protein [Caudoviricetes sp.]